MEFAMSPHPDSPGPAAIRSGLERLEPARRVDSVFEQLRSKILAGVFPAGAQLPNERDLAQALGVNRASVREALKRLEFLELIEVRHGSGNFVREKTGSSALQLVEAMLRDRSLVTRELLRQLLEFRRHIVTQAVELAAAHRSEAHILRGRELMVREAESAGDPASALALDIAMNQLLGEASGNLMYQLVTNLFTRLLERLGPLYYNERRDYRRSLDTHRRLLAALEARDSKTARAVLDEMLAYSEAAILREAGELERAGLIGPGAAARSGT
jgi:GntR family transcriptional repressor for pyruvate dehydrogenase complex